MSSNSLRKKDAFAVVTPPVAPTSPPHPAAPALAAALSAAKPAVTTGYRRIQAPDWLLMAVASVLGFVDANCYDPPIPDEHRAVFGISPGDAGMRRAATHWVFTRRAIWCVGDNGSGRHRLYIVQSDQPGARVGDFRLLPSAVRVFDFDLMESP